MFMWHGYVKGYQSKSFLYKDVYKHNVKMWDLRLYKWVHDYVIQKITLYW
jgi:hypothetical protein